MANSLQEVIQALQAYDNTSIADKIAAALELNLLAISYRGDKDTPARSLKHRDQRRSRASALPWAMRSFSAGLTGICSKKARACSIEA